jgi:hypothetical protein
MILENSRTYLFHGEKPGDGPIDTQNCLHEGLVHWKGVPSIACGSREPVYAFALWAIKSF